MTTQRRHVRGAECVAQSAWRRRSETEIGQSGMIRRPGAGAVPMILPVGGLDRQVVDRGVALAHQALLVEFPFLVAVGAEPVPGIVLPLIGEAHRDAVVLPGPELLDQAVLQLLVPFA